MKKASQTFTYLLATNSIISPQAVQMFSEDYHNICIYMLLKLFFFLFKALELKNKGNEAYKKKELDTAIDLYTQAFELDGTNITFLTNRAGTVCQLLI